MTSETPAEPVKRGRGRPRKPDSEKKQPPKQPDDGTPRRGRGRPRKPDSEKKQPPKQPDDGTPRRGRGRPRKLDSEKKQPPQKPDDGTPRRGRGRPKGSTNKPKLLTVPAGVVKSSAATATPGKRGPGRPRKSAVTTAPPAAVTPVERRAGSRLLRARKSDIGAPTAPPTPVKAQGRRKSAPAATKDDEA
ncbi:hypothetical protein ACHAQA_008372 [Verticillium albo-atrum]